MVLDGSLVSRRILEVCLHREGYDVVSYEEAEEARRALADPRCPVPDLAFLAGDLPAMGGFLFALLLRITPQFRQVPIVMLLQQQQHFVGRVKARVAGANAIVWKPLRRHELIAVAHAYLGSRAAEPPGLDP
jgi:twitching motility two-component system response regulator PilG